MNRESPDSVPARPADVEDANAGITGTHFLLSTVQMSIRFVLESATSLRAAASVLRIIPSLEGEVLQTEMSHTTIRNLILRVGLYEVTRSDRFAEDWIWIIDHSIQAGTTKCFLVLGIRQREYISLQRPLEHRDMSVLALIPVETSTGVIVHEQLTEVADRCGVPRAILSDHGSDLKKGVELLQQEHPGVAGVYDVVHLVSGLVDKLLRVDEQWAEYRKACCQCANSVRQSNFAQLKPPTPKTKARQMNIGREIEWGVSALALLSKARTGRLSEAQQRDLPLPQLEEKLGWLDDYREALERWDELHQVCRQACTTVRRFGYDGELEQRLKSELPVVHSVAAKTLVSQILAFGTQTAANVGSIGRVPGSSEVIESLIGKGKRLAGVHGSSGMTAQLLAMAAAVTQPTREFLSEALYHTGMKQLQHWCSQFLPISLHSKRKRDLQSPEAEQNLRKENGVSIPAF